MTKDSLVLAYVFETPVEAAIAQGLLDSNEIPSMLTNTDFSSLYPIGNPAISGVRMMVFERDLPRALELLRNHGDIPAD